MPRSRFLRMPPMVPQLAPQLGPMGPQLGPMGPQLGPQLGPMIQRALRAPLVFLALLARQTLIGRIARTVHTARTARMAFISPVSSRTLPLTRPIPRGRSAPPPPQAAWAGCSASSPASRRNRGAFIPPAAIRRSSRRLDSRSKRLLRVPLLKSWTRETRKPRPSFDSITLAYRAFKNRSETRCLICRA